MERHKFSMLPTKPSSSGVKVVAGTKQQLQAQFPGLQMIRFYGRLDTSPGRHLSFSSDAAITSPIDSIHQEKNHPWSTEHSQRVESL